MMKELGKRPPRYRFILNPYTDVRFSTCPACRQRTLLRKVPLAVHVDPHHPILLNKSCRFCPDCDLLIAHQDEVEHSLALSLTEHAPEISGNDYFVIGTVDKATWRQLKKAPVPMGALPEYLHGFKEYLTVSHTPGGWYPKDQPPTPITAPPPAEKPVPSPPEIPPALAIDDPQQVENLIAGLEAQVPIPAEIHRGTANYLRAQGVDIPRHRNVHIHHVFYAGDEGGILCALSPADSPEPVVISLTQLKIPYRHPLEKDIRAYQKTRTQKLRASRR